MMSSVMSSSQLRNFTGGRLIDILNIAGIYNENMPSG